MTWWRGLASPRDIARGGDQEPGDRFYFLTTFFLSPNVFFWRACLQGCMLSFFALLALLPVCLVLSARHRWPRTPAKCSARICDAARSLRQRCGAVFFVGHPEGPSFLGVARAPRPRVCCIGGLRCARRSFEIIIYIENDAFWGRSVGAGLGPEVVLGGRVPCSLRLVGLVRACVGQEVVVCVCLLCRLLRGQTHLSMHSAVGRVGAGVVLGVMVGEIFFAFLWSVVG